MSEYDYKAIDAVVNIWNEEALRQRPGWGDDFFQKKMNSKSSTGDPIEIDQLVEILDDAGIDKAFLIAAYSVSPRANMRRRIATRRGAFIFSN